MFGYMFFLRLAICVLLFQSTSCINLKEVHDYSSRSVKTIQKFEELDFDFSKACREKCLLAQLEQQKISTNECFCPSEKSADSVTNILYKVLEGYYSSLTNLAANKLTDYNFNRISKALNEGDFGPVKISKIHSNAYAKIASILAKTLTDGYRKKKISFYIGESNEAIKQLLESLSFTMSSNLARRLETQKERLKSYYFDLSTDGSTSVYEKKKIIEEYSTVLNELDTKRKQIESFSKGLTTIAKGHQQLYEYRDRLKAGEIRNILREYAQGIEDIVAEFNKIKKVD